MTRPNYHKHLTINAQTLSPPFQAFYLMTDGLSGDLLYSPDQPAVEEWAQRVDANVRFSATPAQATAGMLHWLATYQITGSWDDRTLVVITRQENNNGSYQSRRG